MSEVQINCDNITTHVQGLKDARDSYGDERDGIDEVAYDGAGNRGSTTKWWIFIADMTYMDENNQIVEVNTEDFILAWRDLTGGEYGNYE